MSQYEQELCEVLGRDECCCTDNEKATLKIGEALEGVSLPVMFTLLRLNLNPATEPDEPEDVDEGEGDTSEEPDSSEGGSENSEDSDEGGSNATI